MIIYSIFNVYFLECKSLYIADTLICHLYLVRVAKLNLLVYVVL